MKPIFIVFPLAARKVSSCVLCDCNSHSLAQVKGHSPGAHLEDVTNANANPHAFAAPRPHLPFLILPSVECRKTARVTCALRPIISSPLCSDHSPLKP